MGKKRIVKKTETAPEGEKKGMGVSMPKRSVSSAVLAIESTYNNTKAVLSDTKGGVLSWSSSGSLGFAGAKKGTPFAAAKVGEILGERAALMGVKDITVIVKGVGSGRESLIRGFISKSNFSIVSIKDTTPVPFNGPRPKKARRV